MIPSLENLKELEILIRFDCSCPNMSEITLNIIIDEHSREFENSLKIWYVECRTIILRSSSTPTMLQPTQSSEIIPNFKMVQKWMGSLLMLNKFSTLLKLFSEIVSRSRSFQVAWQQGWITIETIPRHCLTKFKFILFKTYDNDSCRMAHIVW